jgi:hypothetical protein
LQELLSGEKPRFSINGWYHKATLQAYHLSLYLIYAAYVCCCWLQKVLSDDKPRFSISASIR